MPNRPIDSHRLAAPRRKKFNLNFRAQGQIRHGKQTHPDFAEVDAKSTHAGRPGEDLHGGVQQLALSAAPVFDVGLEHHPGYRSGKDIALTLVSEGYGGSVEAIGTWLAVEIKAITQVCAVCSLGSPGLSYDVLVRMQWSTFTDTVKRKIRQIRVGVISITLSVAFTCLGTSLPGLLAQARQAPDKTYSFKRMADGKQWMTNNLDGNTVPSYCYEDAELNCHRYGRLYTWESARRVCQSLGDGWRLPTDGEWRQMAKHYGGVSEDSDDSGKTAYKALLVRGNSGFNALLGGGRSEEGQYARLEAHGFYWTASETDSVSGWFYNFGRGGQALHRQSGGEKERAFSVRCVRE